MKKTIISLTLTVAIFCAYSVNSMAQALAYPNGSTVANFELTDVNNITYSLDEIAASGKWMLIEAFAAPAEVCRDYSPLVNEFYDKHGCNAGDVFVISVSGYVEDGNAEVIAYDEAYGGSFHHSPIVPGKDGDNESGINFIDQFGILGAPTFVLIDPDKKMAENDAFPVFGTADDFSLYFYIGEAPADMACSFAGIEDNEIITDFLTYPNPAIESLTVEYNAAINDHAIFEVINVLGEVLISTEMNQSHGFNTQWIDISTLEQGQYWLRMTANNETKVSQFQKL